VNELALDKIEATPDGGLRIGALVRTTDLARRRTRAARLSAAVARAVGRRSGQLRNRATTAGNLLQRTRCAYFYDTNQACNKRDPGSGCAAHRGFSRQLAVSVPAMPASHAPFRHGRCHARAGCHGRDRAAGWQGAQNSARRFPHLAGATRRTSRPPAAQRVDHRRDLAQTARRQAALRKVRDRSSYAFALVSIGASCSPTAPAAWRVGGVAHKPWRVKPRSAELPRGAKAVAARLLAGARPTHDNEFKVTLVERALEAVLADARSA
jgi:xanthine dehydrogenase YagS FAD-binding subunit